MQTYFLDFATWNQSEIISLPSTILEINHLDENTDYIFIGVAREASADRETFSSEFNFHTDSSRTTSHINLGLKEVLHIY